MRKKIQLEDATKGFEVEGGKVKRSAGKWRAVASMMGSMKNSVKLGVGQA